MTRLFIWIVCLSLSCQVAAQERIFELHANPAQFPVPLSGYRSSAAVSDRIWFQPDTLPLPFFDDFSGDKFAPVFWGFYPSQAIQTFTFYNVRLNGLPPTVPELFYSRDSTFVIDSTATPVSRLPLPLGALSFFHFPLNEEGSPFVADSSIFAFRPYNIIIKPGGIQDTIPVLDFLRDTVISFPFDRVRMGALPGLWMNRKKSVFLNSTFPVNPPTIGVATFDGLAWNGRPYNFIPSSYGSADTLTSKPINLNYSPLTGAYLSFYYQPQGLGNDPELKDTLVLEFKSPGREWSHVWSKTGFPLGNDTNFRRVMLHITDTAWLKNGFQFRFRNYATLSGSTDHWHLDQVQVVANVSDTSLADVAFVYPMTSILQDYQSLPVRHYVPAMMASVQTNRIRNTSTTTQNLSYRFRITDYFGGNPQTGFDVDNVVFNPTSINSCDFCTRVINPLNGLGYAFPSAGPCSEYLITQYIQPLSLQAERSNDTLRYVQRFADEFCLDDGSAEAAYGFVNSPGTQMLTEFSLLQSDTLRGLSIYFNPVLDDASEIPFELVVRKKGVGDFPGDSLFAGGFFLPSYANGVNGFTRYALPNALVLPSGTYYAGVRCSSSLPLNIGFDRNHNNQFKHWFRQPGSGWFNTQFSGSWMMRPWVGSCPGGLPSGILKDEIADWQLFPNPANKGVTLVIPIVGSCQISIFDALGRLVLHQGIYSGEQVSVAQLEPGFYSVQLSGFSDAQSPFKVKRLMIAH